MKKLYDRNGSNIKKNVENIGKRTQVQENYMQLRPGSYVT